MTLRGQQWGEPGGEPVLALHGWLDNSASFEPLAGWLAPVHLVALDLAGHGRSDHRPGVGPYNLWEDVADIIEVADQLGWERFSLLGHSRGGIIGMLVAGAFPERVSRLALIDALWPEAHDPKDAPEQLARSIGQVRALQCKPLTVYRSLSLVARARERGLFPLSHAAATLLSERGTRAVPGGYCWSTDQRLLAPSAIKLTEAYLEAFLQRARAEMCMILGEQGVVTRFPHYQSALECFPARLQWTFLSGGHHLHMETEVDAVAEKLNRFFRDQPID